jgi:hypothetical protein
VDVSVRILFLFYSSAELEPELTLNLCPTSQAGNKLGSDGEALVSPASFLHFDFLRLADGTIFFFIGSQHRLLRRFWGQYLDHEIQVQQPR